jgi:hypothetical protein
MFHDCGNEGNGQLTWDNGLVTLLPMPTGCDASILFSKEQLSIPANQGRMIKTAEGERAFALHGCVLFHHTRNQRNSQRQCMLTLFLLDAVLHDNIYEHVNDELEAYHFLKDDATPAFSGACCVCSRRLLFLEVRCIIFAVQNNTGDEGFCAKMCNRWCNAGTAAATAPVDADEADFYNLFYYSEADDVTAMPRDLPR